MTGWLAIAGLGPGDPDLVTPEVTAALAQATDVIGYVPYVASKGAMLGLTKSLARELGPHGIRVNAVSPGAVVSEAEERVFAGRLQQYNDWILENQSLKARIQPADVANLVHFLVSPAANMISGQNIAIDGGW